MLRIGVVHPCFNVTCAGFDNQLRPRTKWVSTITDASCGETSSFHMHITSLVVPCLYDPSPSKSFGSVLRSACRIDDLSRDEPGAVAHEEGRKVRDVIRLSDSVDRDLGRSSSFEIVE